MALHSRHNILEVVLISVSVCLSALLLDSLLDSGTPVTSPPSNMFTMNIPLKANNLHFEFAAQDGSVLLPCRHRLLSDLTEDWVVTCVGPGQGDRRRFSVHLWLKTFTRAKGMIRTENSPASAEIGTGLVSGARANSATERSRQQGNPSLAPSGEAQTTYEVFYWVKDRSNTASTPARSQGATMRLKLKGSSEAAGLDLVQEVDGNHFLRARIRL